MDVGFVFLTGHSHNANSDALLVGPIQVVPHGSSFNPTNHKVSNPSQKCSHWMLCPTWMSCPYGSLELLPSFLLPVFFDVFGHPSQRSCKNGHLVIEFQQSLVNCRVHTLDSWSSFLMLAEKNKLCVWKMWKWVASFNAWLCTRQWRGT